MGRSLPMRQPGVNTELSDPEPRDAFDPVYPGWATLLPTDTAPAE
jgi:hypothetical protein